MDRTPGRYNLHKLGWKQFEDLVIEINRTILGATVTPFRVGPDGGRDGFFKGQLVGEYLAVAPEATSVTFQCKHTSLAETGITPSVVKAEIPKVQALADAGDADLFIIFTNRRSGGPNDSKIRSAFEAIPGVQRCCVFGEEWIESHIDGNYRLLRRVPRLYGIGDLSQIFSAGLSEQTQLLLETMKEELAVFVPTDSYLNAVQAMEEHGMVVLVGAAASGKTSIALNLCSVFCAEDKDLEVLKIDSVDQFTQSWSARDTKKLFWMDDFLGETTFDDQRAKPWSTVLEKLRTAWKAGNKFIFTSRDYVLKEAGSTLRAKTIEFFENREVIVSVDDLSRDERSRILYNHIKLGDLSGVQKKRLKPYLPMISELRGFTPELARRLGSARFHDSLAYTSDGLQEFVERPVHFFSEVIRDLSVKQRASILLLLLSNNALKDPVGSVPDRVEQAYGVNVADVRQALMDLRGSLTKVSVIGTDRVWQVHHPSMIDAMYQILRDLPAMFDIFVDVAPLDVVLRDFSTKDEPHRLFVSQSLYPELCSRVLAAQAVDAARFFGHQHQAFLMHIIESHPTEVATIMAKAINDAGEHEGLRFLIRVESVLGRSFDEGRRSIEGTAADAVWEHGCAEVMRIKGFDNPLDSGVLRAVLFHYETEYETTLATLVERIKYKTDTLDEAIALHGYVDSFVEILSTVAQDVMAREEYDIFTTNTQPFIDSAQEEIRAYLSKWESHIEDEADDLRYREPEPRPVPDRLSFGMFADVDE